MVDKHAQDKKSDKTLVVILELPNITVGVLTVASITRSQSELPSTVDASTPVPLDWTAQEKLRDRMIVEVDKL